MRTASAFVGTTALAWLVLGAAGCARPGTAEPRADAPAAAETPASSPAPAKAPAKPKAKDPAPAPVDTAMAEPMAADREVAVDLDAAKKAELVVQARKDLVEAERLIGTLPPGGSAARTEKVRVVEGLIDQARAALTATNPDAAATLAHKARLLAEEIAASQ